MWNSACLYSNIWNVKCENQYPNIIIYKMLNVKFNIIQ